MILLIPPLPVAACGTSFHPDLGRTHDLEWQITSYINAISIANAAYAVNATYGEAEDPLGLCLFRRRLRNGLGHWIAWLQRSCAARRRPLPKLNSAKRSMSCTPTRSCHPTWVPTAVDVLFVTTHSATRADRPSGVINAPADRWR